MPERHDCIDLQDLPEGEVRVWHWQQGRHRDRQILLLRQGERVYAYENLCPHALVPLNIASDAFMDYDGRYLQCSNHFAQFRIEDGVCIHGPCKGQALQSFEVEIERGRVYLLLPADPSEV